MPKRLETYENWLGMGLNGLKAIHTVHSGNKCLMDPICICEPVLVHVTDGQEHWVHAPMAC